MAEATVLISYNPVRGFKSGWHGDGKVFVCANDAGSATRTGNGNDDYQRARSIMHSISGKYYHGEVPVVNVREYFVYSGFYAFESAIGMAKGLRSAAPGVPVTVVACSCDWDKKESLLIGTGIRLIGCECTGSQKMGRLAERALEG